MKLPLVWVDAFTAIPYAGNPCAVVLDADGLDEVTMLRIAREMNLSETAFVRGSDRSDFAVRFFTPVEEIPLAGHPTIATAWALRETGRIRPTEGDAEIEIEIELELVEGPIRVTLRSDGITMRQRRPRFGRTHDPETVLPAFGLGAADLAEGLPVQTVSTGTSQLMVPVRDHTALRRAALDVDRYHALKAAGDFFSPHLFCLTGATPDGHTFARHFGVPPDTLEDPFTGSATGGMAAYLWHHGALDDPRFVAEQGHWMGRPGRAGVEVVGPPGAIETVLVTGRAVTILVGEIRIL